MSCCKKNSGKCASFQEIKTVAHEVPDYLVCICMGVMRSEIIEAIEAGATTFEELSDKLGVGTGCSSCIPEVQDILRDKLHGGCCRS